MADKHAEAMASINATLAEIVTARAGYVSAKAIADADSDAQQLLIDSADARTTALNESLALLEADAIPEG
jgi:hypothetical protein